MSIPSTRSKMAVLLSVFNNQVGLERSLRSLARADCGGVTVVTVDDGSQPPMIPRFDLVGGDSRVHIQLDSNRGLAAALNEGLRWISNAGIPYVARLDAGDTVFPHRFRAQMDYLDRHPETAVVGSYADFFCGESGLTVFQHRCGVTDLELRQEMKIKNVLLHPTLAFQTVMAQQIGFYHASLAVSEDYEFLMRLGDIGKFAAIPEVLTSCEHTLHGISNTKRRRQLFQKLVIQLRWFSKGSVASYVGVLRTLIAMVVPRKLALARKIRARQV